jgi:hypothetical protein
MEIAMTTSFKSEAVARLHSQAGSIERKIETLKTDVGVEVDEKAVEYMNQHPDVSYSTALEAVFAEFPNLAKKYEESFVTTKHDLIAQHAAADDDDQNEEGAGKEIDKLCTTWLREHPKESYEKALSHVRESRPDLWKRYERKRG